MTDRALLEAFAAEQRAIGVQESINKYSPIQTPHREPPETIRQLDPAHPKHKAVLSPLEKPFLTYEEAKQMIDRLYKEGYLP